MVARSWLEGDELVAPECGEAARDAGTGDEKQQEERAAVGQGCVLSEAEPAAEHFQNGWAPGENERVLTGSITGVVEAPRERGAVGKEKRDCYEAAVVVPAVAVPPFL